MPADLRSMNGSNNRDKTHCPAGHPLSGENLVEYGGSRQCKECRAQRNLKRDRRMTPDEAQNA